LSTELVYRTINVIYFVFRNMTEVQSLELQKELHDWHSNKIQKSINKIRAACEHNMKEFSSTARLEYDFAFFYKVIDSKCTKCGLIKSSNHFL
jgi:hypothetical protein